MIRQRLFHQIILLFGIYLVLKGCWLIAPRIFQTIELQTQDAMLRLSLQFDFDRDISPDIVYVDIDDASIPQLPYRLNSPQLYADLITAIGRAGAALQIIDILFVSENQSSILNSAIAESNNVYLPAVFKPISRDATTTRTFPGSIAIEDASEYPFPQGQPFLTTAPAGLDSVRAVGHINSTPDIDGVYRRLPLFIQSGGHLIATISLQAAMDYLGVPRDRLHFSQTGLEIGEAFLPDGRQRQLTVPYDANGRTRINFVGSWPRVFAHYSAATILEKSRDPAGRLELLDELEGSFVILADVTTSGRDFGPVPLASHAPLCELHAHFLNSIFTDAFVREASWPTGMLVEVTLIVILAVLAWFSQGVRMLGFIFLLGILFSISSFSLLAFARFYLPVVLPLALIVLGASAILLLQYITIQQEKNIIKARLSPYFAPTVMDKILAAPELLKAVSRKRLTILFSDIADFTEWSTTREASEIHQALSRYFSEMSGIVFSFEGTIDKFMGDGMLAFFGDPVDHPDHAERAVMTALAMQRKAAELRQEWSVKEGMDIRLRIGIHTGEVAVGNMGSMERLDYTVVGSHVNLAQRLESHCTPGKILISRDVHRELGEAFKTIPHGAIKAKGFADPVDTYYVDGYHAPEDDND